MPTENFMYSVLEGTDLPEDKGYRFHSTVPTQAAEISASEIAETWNRGSKIGTKQWLLLDRKTKPVAYLAVTIYTLLIVVPLWLAVDRLIWVAGFDLTNWISSLDANYISRSIRVYNNASGFVFISHASNWTSYRLAIGKISVALSDRYSVSANHAVCNAINRCGDGVPAYHRGKRVRY